MSAFLGFVTVCKDYAHLDDIYYWVVTGNCKQKRRANTGAGDTAHSVAECFVEFTNTMLGLVPSTVKVCV